MSKHKSDKSWAYWYIRRLKMDRHYVLNQWHYFKKPALKKWWSRVLANTSSIGVLLTNRRNK